MILHCSTDTLHPKQHSSFDVDFDVLSPWFSIIAHGPNSFVHPQVSTLTCLRTESILTSRIILLYSPYVEGKRKGPPVDEPCEPKNQNEPWRRKLTWAKGRTSLEAGHPDRDVLQLPPLILHPKRGRRTATPLKPKRRGRSFDEETRVGKGQEHGRTLSKVHAAVDLWAGPLRLPANVILGSLLLGKHIAYRGVYSPSPPVHSSNDTLNPKPEMLRNTIFQSTFPLQTRRPAGR